jgi:HlyD family secretion protein
MSALRSIRDLAKQPVATGEAGLSPMDRPVQRSRWRRVALTAGGVLAALALIALVLSSLRTGSSVRLKAAAVSIAPVERALFHDFVPVRGRVVPRDIVYLDAQEGGRVERVHVQAGDGVTAGQPLIEFGNTELQLEVIDREARLIEQINYLRATEISLEQTRLSNERALMEIDYNVVRLGRLAQRRDTLASRGATSAEEKDRVSDELTYFRGLRPIVAESNKKQESLRVQRLPEIRDGLQKLQQNLAITRGKLDNLVVRAPVSGQLTDMDLKVGQHTERGSRLAEITPDTGFKLTADVDEFYLGRVRTGQQAEMELAGKYMTLRVSRVYPQVKDGRFTVDLAFDTDAPEGLLPGQAVQGRLQLGEDRLATVVPAGAFLEQTGGDWIFVLTQDGQSAERRRIKAGRRNVEQLEVLSGLQPGERVVISDYRGLDRIDRIDLTATEP